MSLNMKNFKTKKFKMKNLKRKPFDLEKNSQ